MNDWLLFFQVEIPSICIIREVSSLTPEVTRWRGSKELKPTLTVWGCHGAPQCVSLWDSAGAACLLHPGLNICPNVDYGLIKPLKWFFSGLGKQWRYNGCTLWCQSFLSPLSLFQHGSYSVQDFCCHHFWSFSKCGKMKKQWKSEVSGQKPTSAGLRQFTQDGIVGRPFFQMLFQLIQFIICPCKHAISNGFHMPLSLPVISYLRIALFSKKSATLHLV